MANPRFNSRLIRYPEFTKDSMEELIDSIILFHPLKGQSAYNADEIARGVIDSFNSQKNRPIIKTLISTVLGDFETGKSSDEYSVAIHKAHRLLHEYKMGIPVYYFPSILNNNEAKDISKFEFISGLHRHVANRKQIIVVVIEKESPNREYVEMSLDLYAPELVVCNTLSHGIHTACNLFSMLEEAKKGSISNEQV